MTALREASASSRPRPRLLVVEDDAVLAGMIRDILDDHDLELDLAGSVEAAERLLMKGRYDLLLLDISLPGENGLSWFRRVPASSLPPVLFMSAIDRIAHGGTDIPAESWLAKPFGPDELVCRLRNALGDRAPGPTPPLENAAPGGTQYHRTTAQDAHAPRILLVEDDPLLAELMREFLGWHGFEVAVASRLGEARNELAQRWNAVVLDGSLPDGNGIDLLREIRSTPSTVDLPVLMLSGRTSADDVQACMLAGADDHLGKPFSEESLVARLTKLLSRSRPQPT